MSRRGAAPIVRPRRADPTPLPPVRWLWGSAADSPVLELDAAGREAARRHASEGNHGATVVEMPRSLPDWHLAALEQRDKRWAREVPRWATVTLLDAPTEQPESFEVRTHYPLPMQVAKVGT